MMSIDEIEAYRKKLECEIRDHDDARGGAMSEGQYSDMKDYSCALDRTVTRIDTLNIILQD